MSYNKTRPKGDKFIVRLYDGFDNQWIDVSDILSWEDAKAFWDEKTENGTKKTKYSDIDYYDIFSANTTMLYADGYGAQYEE